MPRENESKANVSAEVRWRRERGRDRPGNVTLRKTASPRCGMLSGAMAFVLGARTSGRASVSHALHEAGLGLLEGIRQVWELGEVVGAARDLGLPECVIVV